MIKRFFKENPNLNFDEYKDKNRDIIKRYNLDTKKKIILYLMNKTEFINYTKPSLKDDYIFTNNIYLFNDKETIVNNITSEIIILIPVWGRNKILQKCMDDLFDKGLKKKLIYIVSDDMDLDIIRKNNVYYSYSPNYPLGNKFNNMVKLIQNIKCNYFMILGSDDTLPYDYISKSIYLLENENYSMIGTDVQIIHYGDNIYKRKYINHYNRTFGSGRIYKKEVGEFFKYNLFNSKINKSIDRSITKKMKIYNLKMGTNNSNIISYYCENNNITKFEDMFIKSNEIIKIK
jgi:hypothetical protein